MGILAVCPRVADNEVMITLGIIGGIASGKSTVAKEFLQLVPAAVTLDADQLGHRVLTEPDVIAALRVRWGDAILDENGAVNRPAVAKIVFAPGNERQLQFLEQVSHPRIRRLLEAELQQLRKQQAPLAVIDAALLLETGWSSVCDKLLFVSVPEAIRRERAHSRGWSDEEFQRREQAQWPIAKKEAAADFTVVNDGDLESLARQCAEVWSKLQSTTLPK